MARNAAHPVGPLPDPPWAAAMRATCSPSPPGSLRDEGRARVADERAVGVERVRAAIEGLMLRTPTRVVPVTSSFGGCTWHGDARERGALQKVVKTLIDSADLALYDAKKAGRNRICWRPYGGGG